MGCCFLLTDFDEEGYGTVVYVGEPHTEESIRLTKKLIQQGKSICNIYEPYDCEEVS